MGAGSIVAGRRCRYIRQGRIASDATTRTITIKISKALRIRWCEESMDKSKSDEA